MCSRNEDGTGTVFDLTNIIPWLKYVRLSFEVSSRSHYDRQHNNTHPITSKPLPPSSLITLHYARNAQDKLHDPIAFKVFSEHSHIVAVATTGNVFLQESLKNMNGRDLIADKEFKKYASIACFFFVLMAPAFRDDVITLQNPHAVPTAPLPTIAEVPNQMAPQKKAASSKAGGSQPATVPAVKPKAPVPCASYDSFILIRNSFN